MQDQALDLLVAALFCFTICCFSLRKQLAPCFVLSIAFFKTIIPLLYFAFFFQNEWGGVDDVFYLNIGRSLLEAGYAPFDIINSEFRSVLSAFAGGKHILYPWWGFLAQYLLGPHYYSGVFFNVGLSVISSVLFIKTLELVGFSKAYLTAALVFLLFSPELTAWSSFLNLKDTLVVFMINLSFFLALRFRRQKRISDISLLLCLLLLFYWIRFYLPVIFLVSYLLWLSGRLPVRYQIGALLVLSAAVILIASTKYSNLFAPSSVGFGFLRMLLTPRPWGISETDSFLVLPSIIYLGLLVPAILGGIGVYGLNFECRFFIVFLFAILLFYAFFPDLQGPRQRLQVATIIAWLQFHGLLLLLRLHKKVSCSSKVSPLRSEFESSNQGNHS